MADMQANILIKILDAFTGPLRGLATGVDDVKGRANKLKDSFKFAGDLNQAAEGAGRFGDMMRAPLQNAVKEFATFEAEMSKVAALSGEVGTEGFAKMREQALELGAATAYSSEEAASAMAAYAQAGRSAQEIIAITPMTLAAAKAAGTDLGTTAQIIGATMQGMGLDASQTARTVDVLTQTTVASSLELGELGIAMSYIGPVAREANMSLEMTTSMVAKLRDAGIEASSAGTGMRAVIARLTAPSKEATKSFAEMGIKTKALAEIQKLAAAGHMDEALRKIGAATDKLPDETRLKLMNKIFGEQAQTSATVLIRAAMDPSEKGLAAMNRQLLQSAGSTEKLAQVMGDNLMGSLERAGGAISGLNVSIGEALAPTVKSAAGSVEGLAGGLQEWTQENPRATVATAKMVGGLAALSLALKGGLLAASAFTAASASVQLAFLKMSGSMLGKLGLVAAAGAAGYALGSWANEFFELDDKISSLLGRSKADSRGKPGLGGAGERQVYAGGWETQGGAIVKMGTGPGPKSVQEARAAGAKSLEEINAFISKKQTSARLGTGGQGGTQLAREAGQAAQNVSPLADASAALPAIGTPAALTGNFAAATQEQTAALLETLRKQEKNQADMLNEMRKRPGGAPFPAAPGAF